MPHLDHRELVVQFPGVYEIMCLLAKRKRENITLSLEVLIGGKAMKRKEGNRRKSPTTIRDSSPNCLMEVIS
jgi:hypothetical protein